MRATADKVTGSEKAGETEGNAAPNDEPRERERATNLNFFTLHRRQIVTKDSAI